MLACFKVGAVPVPTQLPVHHTELRYAYAGRTGGFGPPSGDSPRRSARPSMPMDERRLVLEVDDGTASDRAPWADDYEALLSTAEAARRFGPRSADDLYCVYTGGTTGRPKGVLSRHGDLFFSAMGGGDPLHLGDVIQRHPSSWPGASFVRAWWPCRCRFMHASPRRVGLLDLLRRRLPGPAARGAIRPRHHLAPRRRRAGRRARDRRRRDGPPALTRRVAGTLLVRPTSPR